MVDPDGKLIVLKLRFDPSRNGSKCGVCGELLAPWPYAVAVVPRVNYGEYAHVACAKRELLNDGPEEV
jgi:hypothetical protein